MRLINLLIAFVFCQTLVAQVPPVLDPPPGTLDGINYIDQQTVILQLGVPNKAYVHAIGDFNNWTANPSSLMNMSVDGFRHWIQLENLVPGCEYRYQYLVEGTLEIADPYSEKILDEWNDGFIPDEHYPALIDYPFGETSWPVSIFQTAEPAYIWNDASYSRPSQDRLVIYELLIRDFEQGQEFQDVIDRLDYLQNLGITAIELMPVNEFDGNLSWGYNPNFFFAPDKYYGPKHLFQRLVDEAHQRGIAVIMDVVMNHSFGLNPQVRMFFDGSAPTADNPWFNVFGNHPFGVGYDYNHESPWTKDFFKRMLLHWIEEYHIDGYRIDLSKGLTQTNSGGDISAWSAYDQSRVDILNEYGNHVWGNYPGTYIILEHFADNSEETVLADVGFVIWGNLHFDYSEATMGYSADLNWGAWTNRGYVFPNLLTYMESHDEERMQFLNSNYGNSFGGYDVTDPATGLERLEMAHCFLQGMPGPKMVWQGGELGYDHSIELCGDGVTLNSACRTDEKPEQWPFLADPNRVKLFKVVRALNNLRKDHDAFATWNFNADLSGTGKRLLLYHSDMDVVINGNFDVVGFNMVPGFSHTGDWYDYFTGATINVTDINDSQFFNPGEYHIYTDVPLPTPDIDGNTSIFNLAGCTDPNAINYNPAADEDDGSCLYNLTFQVDMSDETVSPVGVHVAGSFQGWNPSGSPMTNVGGGIYEHTIQTTAGGQIEYKYINGNDWPQEELVPSKCGLSNGVGGYNRVWIVAPNSESIPLHCFGQCGPCEVTPVNLTFQVDMSNETVSIDGVHIAGSFQGWNPSSSLMTDLGGGIYSFSTQLFPGTNIEFKYVNGNAWGQDEAVPAECSQNANRFHTVGSSDEILDLHCYASCTTCVIIPGQGCTYEEAMNYDPSAIDDDGSCMFGPNYCGPNTFWDEALQQCVGMADCPGDLNQDLFITVADLLIMLTYLGEACE